MFKKLKLKHKHKISRQTFTKRLVLTIIIFAEIDVQLTYVLAFLNREIAETLGVAIVTEILGVSIGYFAKAYLETKAERHQNLEQQKFNAFINSEDMSIEEEQGNGNN